MIYKPASYQRQGTIELLKNPHFGLLFDPGLGKTATVLHAIKSWVLCHERPFRALVIAPRLVCTDTWPAEVDKWDQFKDLSILQLRNEKTIDFNREENLWLINPELPRLAKLFGQLIESVSIKEGLSYQGLDAWLANSTQRNKFEKAIEKTPSLWPWNALIVDESSKFKNPKAKRFKLLRRFLSYFRRRVILTGTFAPNGLLDVYTQQYILDQGEALGPTLTGFRNKYFYMSNPRFFTYEIKGPEAARDIERQIAPSVLRLDAAEHLDLPELVHNKIEITLEDKVQSTYEEIEKDFFTELDNGDNLIAPSSSSKYLLCRQLANGSYYDPDREDKAQRVALGLHKAKTERLSGLIDELNGKPLLVAYVFRSDAEQIKKDLKCDFPTIGGQTTEKKAREYLARWNRRELPVLLAQCSSISHGLNMQAGGNDLCFYSLTDNLEDYEQLIRRIYRRGVSGQVRVHYLIAKGTIDKAILHRIESKGKTQKGFLESIAKYRKEKTDE